MSNTRRWMKAPSARSLALLLPCLLALGLGIRWLQTPDAATPPPPPTLSTAVPVAVPLSAPTPTPTVPAPAPTAPPAPETLAFRDWVNKLPQPGADQTAPNPDLIAEGVRLAQQRSVRMARLIREDPRQALSEAVSYDQYALLPTEVKPWVERPFSERTSYQWLPVCAPPGTTLPPGTPDHLSSVTLPDGSRFNAYTYGQRGAVMSKHSLPVQGIAWGEDAAMHDSVFRRVSAREESTVQAQYPAAKPLTHSFATGQPIAGAPVLALSGGRLYAFATEEEMQQLDRALAQLDEQPGPRSGSQVLYRASPAAGAAIPEGQGFDLESAVEASAAEATTWTETKKKVFMIRVDFSDNTGEPLTTSSCAMPETPSAPPRAAQMPPSTSAPCTTLARATTV